MTNFTRSICLTSRLSLIAGLALLSACGGGGGESTSPQTNVAPISRITASKQYLVMSLDASNSTDSDGSIAQYQWTYGDGQSGNAQRVTHTYPADGTYTITLRVTDNGGASHESRVVVSVSSNRSPEAEFRAALTGMTMAFDASASRDTDGTIASYVWNFGDGQTGVDRLVQHTYATPGQYTITLAVKDDDGAQNVRSRILTVRDNKPPKAALSTAIVGLNARFSAFGSTDPDSVMGSQLWNFGDGQTGSGEQVQHTYAAPGTYLVTLTVTDFEGAADQRTAPIVAHENPAMSVKTELGIGVALLRFLESIATPLPSVQSAASTALAQRQPFGIVLPISLASASGGLMTIHAYKTSDHDLAFDDSDVASLSLESWRPSLGALSITSNGEFAMQSPWQDRIRFVDVPTTGGLSIENVRSFSFHGHMDAHSDWNGLRIMDDDIGLNYVIEAGLNEFDASGMRIAQYRLDFDLTISNPSSVNAEERTIEGYYWVFGALGRQYKLQTVSPLTFQLVNGRPILKSGAFTLIALGGPAGGVRLQVSADEDPTGLLVEIDVGNDYNVETQGRLQHSDLNLTLN